MNRRTETTLTAFALAWAVALFPFTVYGQATQPTTRPVIVVAAGTSLNAVVARAVDGDEIVLADGDYPLTGELAVTRRITLRAQNPGKAVIKFTGTPTDPRWTPEWSQAVYPKANGITLDGLAFNVVNAKAVRLNGVSDVTLRGLTSVASVTAEGQPCGGYWFIDASGTKRLRIEDVTAPTMASYCVFLHDGNSDTVVTNLRTAGSVWQHGFRGSDQNGLTIDKSDLRGTNFGPSYKNVGGISIRGGCRGVRITNSILDRPGIGAQTAEETQVVDDVRLDNCVIVAPWMIHPTAGEVSNAARTNPAGAAAMKQPTNLWVNGVRFDVPAVPTTADVSAATGLKPDALDLLKRWLESQQK